MKTEWKVFWLVFIAYILISVFESYRLDMQDLGYTDAITYITGLTVGLLFGAVLGALSYVTVKLGADPTLTALLAILVPLGLAVLTIYYLVKRSRHKEKASPEIQALER